MKKILRSKHGKHLILTCLITIVGSCIYSANTLADSIIELGVHIGGDELIHGTFDNGKTDSIKAGGLFSFDFGRLYQFAPTWETQVTFGVKSDARYDNETKISWVRYPLNALLFYRMEDMRFGMGATYHLFPKLKGYGLAGNIVEKYNHALGGLMEVDFIRSKTFLWGIRLTLIQYESQVDQHKVDGNSIGLLIIAQL